MTHVLLDVLLGARRADSADVIAAAIEAKFVHGWGHRKIAVWLGRPATTVRGWLRSFAGAAVWVARRFMELIVRDAPDAAVLWPAPAGAVPGTALSAVMAYAEALSQRFGQVVTVPWVRVGIAESNGRLFCRSFWGSPANTNRPL